MNTEYQGFCELPVPHQQTFQGFRPASSGDLCYLGRPLRALLVVAVLAALSPLEQPVALVGVRVPPLAHPVLEPW